MSKTKEYLNEIENTLDPEVAMMNFSDVEYEEFLEYECRKGLNEMHEMFEETN